MLLIGFALFLAFLFYFIQQNLNLVADWQVHDGSAQLVTNTPVIYEQEKKGPGLPIRLKIPSINVDATVEYVGLNSDGAMDVPKSSDNVAWFNSGPRPSENGSAVIAGHYGWRSGIQAVFDELYKVRKGDKIYIEDNGGVVVSFVVRKIRRYDQAADASDVFGSNDGKSHLNLITCEGSWDKSQKSYSDRLVVFADKE